MFRKLFIGIFAFASVSTINEIHMNRKYNKEMEELGKFKEGDRCSSMGGSTGKLQITYF
jgi:hypothetical protein